MAHRKETGPKNAEFIKIISYAEIYFNSLGFELAYGFCDVN